MCWEACGSWPAAGWHPDSAGYAPPVEAMVVDKGWNLLARCVALTFRIFPRSHREEFEGEMRAVFFLVAEEAGRKGKFNQLAWLAREQWGILTEVSREHWRLARERGGGQMNAPQEGDDLAEESRRFTTGGFALLADAPGGFASLRDLGIAERKLGGGIFGLRMGTGCGAGSQQDFLLADLPAPGGYRRIRLDAQFPAAGPMRTPGLHYSIPTLCRRI